MKDDEAVCLHRPPNTVNFAPEAVADRPSGNATPVEVALIQNGATLRQLRETASRLQRFESLRVLRRRIDHELDDAARTTEMSVAA